MKENNLLFDRIRKSALVIILLLIGIAFLILAIVCYMSYGYGTEFFVFALLTALAGEGIYSAVIYKKASSTQIQREKLVAVYLIIWNYTILICFMIIWYKISFSKPIIQDKSYWIYNLLVYYITISFIIKGINKFLRERKKLIEEKAGFTSIFLSALGVAWIIFYLNCFAFYWLYIPKKTIGPGSAPRPSSLDTYEYEFSAMHPVGPSSKEINIGDDVLIDSFINELSNKKIENMRGIEYLQYDLRKSKEPHYMIYPSYKDSKGNDSEGSYDFDKMYFRMMRLYKNGDLILENYRENRSILNYFYSHELYKVTLSQELTNQISGYFETNNGGLAVDNIK